MTGQDTDGLPIGPQGGTVAMVQVKVRDVPLPDCVQVSAGVLA